MSNKRIVREIGKWESEDIITSELAELLRGRYESKNGRKMLTVILSVIGSVLVGAGVILIVASNWNKIPLVPKTILSFLPLAAAQALGVFTYCKKKGSLVWREGVAVLWAAGVFASLAMIGQSFHLANDLAVYLVSAGLLTLPVVFVLDAVSPLVVYFYAVIHGGTLLLTDNASAPYLLALAALTAAGLVYAVLGRKKTDVRSLYAKWCSVIAGTVTLAIIGIALGEELALCLLGMLFVCFYVSAPRDSGAENPFRFFGVLGTVVISVVTALMSSPYTYLYSGEFTFDLGMLLFTALFAMMLIYSVISALRHLRKSVSGMLFASAGALVSVLSFSASLLSLGGTLLAIVFSAAAFALGIGLIVRGAGEGSLKLTNLGLVTVFFMIAYWFFNMISSTLLNGIIFILFGGAILFVNVRLIKKSRAHEDAADSCGASEEEM